MFLRGPKFHRTVKPDLPYLFNRRPPVVYDAKKVVGYAKGGDAALANFKLSNTMANHGDRKNHGHSKQDHPRWYTDNNSRCWNEP